MDLKTAGIGFLALATVPLAFAAYFVHGEVTRLHENSMRGHYFSGHAVGDERFDVLMQLTKRYIAGHSSVPPAMRAGKAFAPAEFLNGELERHGEKWRVRNVHGLVAETYDVT